MALTKARLLQLDLPFHGFGGPHFVGMEMGEGDATKQTSVKTSAFSLNEGKAFNE